MNTGKSFGHREAGQIAAVLFHPGAEPLPDLPRLVVGEGHPVHEDLEAHDFTSPRTSAACFVTSTVR